VACTKKLEGIVSNAATSPTCAAPTLVLSVLFRQRVGMRRLLERQRYYGCGNRIPVAPFAPR
jgi:hypothetical protein